MELLRETNKVDIYIYIDSVEHVRLVRVETALVAKNLFNGHDAPYPIFNCCHEIPERYIGKQGSIHPKRSIVTQRIMYNLLKCIFIYYYFAG